MAHIYWKATAALLAQICFALPRPDLHTLMRHEPEGSIGSLVADKQVADESVRYVVDHNTGAVKQVADESVRYVVDHNTGAVKVQNQHVHKQQDMPLEMLFRLPHEPGCRGPFSVNDGMMPPELKQKMLSLNSPNCDSAMFQEAPLLHRETLASGLGFDASVDFVKQASERISDDKCSIPVLAILVYRHDFLLRALNKLDFPIQELLIHQDGDDANVSKILDDYVASANQSFFRKIRHVMSHRRAGFSMAVNNFIRLYPGEKFWMWLEDDVFMDPGTLAKWYWRMRNVSQNNAVAAVSLGAQFLMKAWSFTRQGVLRVGLMDENFFPGFYEDDDYALRIRFACMSMFGFADLPVLIDDGKVEETTRKDPTEEQRSNPEYYFHFKWGARMGSFNYQKTVDEWRHECAMFPLEEHCTPYGLKEQPMDAWIPFTSHRECMESGKGVVGDPPSCNHLLVLSDT